MGLIFKGPPSQGAPSIFPLEKKTKFLHGTMHKHSHCKREPYQYIYIILYIIYFLIKYIHVIIYIKFYINMKIYRYIHIHIYMYDFTLE